MEAMIKNRKRKVIDIPNDTFRYLSMKAAAKGTNLKNYIENLLAMDVMDMVGNMNDEDAYKWLSENVPEGHVMADEKEQGEFEEWLGIKRK